MTRKQFFLSLVGIKPTIENVLESKPVNEIKPITCLNSSKYINPNPVNPNPPTRYFPFNSCQPL